jgi:hypothetical protein
MNEILNKKLFWLVISLAFGMFFINMFSNKIVDMVISNHYEDIAEIVVKKLQKEYCPSPYGPGVDPDKINIDELMKASSEWDKTWGEQKYDAE